MRATRVRGPSGHDGQDHESSKSGVNGAWLTSPVTVSIPHATSNRG